MLRRSSFSAISSIVLLSGMAEAGEPLFDSKPGHIWDQARDIFYVRRFSSGEVFDHPHASVPPWHEYFPFTFDPAFHEKVVLLLKAVENLPPAQMEEQPAIRRLIFLRELWAVFDGLHLVHNKWEKRQDDPAALIQALARRSELQSRLARIMKRLELTEEEIQALPNAFKITGEKNLFPRTFDPVLGEKPFFPSDLLDERGPWLTYSSELGPSIGGVLHSAFVNQRSVFTLHLRLKTLSKTDPADFSSFGDIVLWGHPADPRKKDIDGETFITGNYNTVRDMPRALDLCVRCHQETLGSRINGVGSLLPYLQTDLQKAGATVIEKKQASKEWKSYLRLRAAEPKTHD